MPIVVNTNSVATIASFNAGAAMKKLQQSVNRLSSGKRIVSPADDAGGLSVHYKLQSVLKRTEATRNNLHNGVSFLQVQDGANQVAGRILDRMAELSLEMEGSGKEPEEVAEVYYHALTDSRPKAFYTAGRDAPLLRHAHRWLPMRLRQRIADRIMTG